ncbi:MAG TPA: phage holin family protein [Gammaproteobacteria bacterium]|nr:phage holin family protein [Gammaproteobacteria bacterium]
MRGIVVRTLIIAAGIGVASWLIPGITVSGPGTLILAAIVMGLVNAFVRPLIVLLTLPLTILTFGLFLLVINAALFGLVAYMLDGFVVAGALPAMLGWLVVVFVSWVAGWFIGPSGRYEIVKRR